MQADSRLRPRIHVTQSRARQRFKLASFHGEILPPRVDLLRLDSVLRALRVEASRHVGRRRTARRLPSRRTPPIGTRLQVFDLLAQPGEALIDGGIRADRLEIAYQAIELIPDTRQARFESGITAHARLGSFLSLADPVGDPALGFVLTLDQERERFDEQALFFGHRIVGQVWRHRSGL